MQPDHIPSPKTAQRIGNTVAYIILALVFSCVVSFFFLFNADAIKILQMSLNLQSKGVTTTGTVTSVEQFKGGSKHNAVFKLTVEFEADGKTYSVKGNAYYPTLNHSWEGESMDVIYDPQDPNTAMINTFNERWMIPITEVLP